MVTVDYKKITNTFRGMFGKIAQNYKDLKWSLDDEQAFLKQNVFAEDCSLFIVIQYGQASISLNSYVLEANFLVLGAANEIETARSFLTEFASTYNLTKIEDITLVVNTPTISSNFNETGNEYRSLYTMQSVLVGGSDMLSFGSLMYGDEEILLLSFQDSTTNNLAPQVYGDSNGRTRSYTVSQTYTFTISTYSLNSQLVKDINDVKYGDKSLEDKKFKLSLKLSNNQGFTNWEFHLVNATFSHSLGNVPSISLTFSL